MGLEVPSSEFPCLALVGTEESSVDGGEFGPLIIRAIPIEGVIVLLLDGDWGAGLGEWVWGIRVAV